MQLKQFLVLIDIIETLNDLMPNAFIELIRYNELPLKDPV
jgi:hypothetical protein